MSGTPVHLRVTLQTGAGGPVPACQKGDQLEQSAAPMTDDTALVTCEACKLIAVGAGGLAGLLQK
jgi:hypothetical protein